MSNTFKVGDVVQLKSGGPTMTVVSGSNIEVVCTWYSPQSDAFKIQTLAIAALKPVRAPSSGYEGESGSP